MPNNIENDFDYGFREFTEEEIEWYRLWFDFLKLTDRNKWSEDVEKHFGDVFICEFEDWWPDHENLFYKMDIFTIDVIPSEDYFRGYYEDDGKIGDNPDVVGLVVHMAAPKQDLREAFDKFLAKYHKGRLAFADFDGCGDVLNLCQKPDTDMLKKILAVYRLYTTDQMKPEKDQMTLWQIEEEVSKTIPLINKSKATLWRLKENDPSIIESRRRSQLTTVRKYLNYAEEILDNIVNGKFPVYTAGKVSD